MKYTIYEKKNGNLFYVMDISAKSAEEALRQFYGNFGDNYGKVVCLPCDIFMSGHHGLEISVTI